MIQIMRKSAGNSVPVRFRALTALALVLFSVSALNAQPGFEDGDDVDDEYEAPVAPIDSSIYALAGLAACLGYYLLSSGKAQRN
ncbi:hypothetical protein [uncultured Flavobacterium sp.]|uniref:hypothetical protein n=1 Tax=uncultured Flavobacterium sp. TaxID=165435 RepID=UPI0025F9B16C|nr:hypothetical protein [uncultured Flavobacterium sp.]